MQTKNLIAKIIEAPAYHSSVQLFTFEHEICGRPKQFNYGEQNKKCSFPKAINKFQKIDWQKCTREQLAPSKNWDCYVSVCKLELWHGKWQEKAELIDSWLIALSHLIYVTYLQSRGSTHKQALLNHRWLMPHLIHVTYLQLWGNSYE